MISPFEVEDGGMQVATRTIVGFRCLKSDEAGLVSSGGKGAGMSWNQGLTEGARFIGTAVTGLAGEADWG